MIFIGKKTAKKLRNMNIFTLYDLSQYNPKILEQTFGVMGKKIYNSVWGIEDDEVTIFNPQDTKSVGNGLTAPKDMVTLQDVKNMLSKLSDMIAPRLRHHNFKAKTIHLSIKFADFSHLGAQKTYQQSFASRELIFKYALDIFSELTNEEFAPIRALRICCCNLEKCNQGEQLSLFEDSKKEKLGFALDAIRDKYGIDSICMLNDIEEI